MLGIVRSQNGKRDKAKQLRQDKTRSKIAQRIEKLQQQAEYTDKEAGGLTARLTSLDLKLRHFEDSFQKITAATGLENPDAIVNKFFFKGEIKEQLEAEIEDKQAQIEQLKQEEGELKSTLTEAKSGFVHDSWRSVEILSEENREKEFEVSMNQTNLSQATQRLNFAQEGMASLVSVLNETMHKSESEQMEGEAGELWTEEQSNAAFEKVNGAVDVLLEVERERDARQQEEAKRKQQEDAKKKMEDGDSFNSYQVDRPTADSRPAEEDS